MPVDEGTQSFAFVAGGSEEGGLVVVRECTVEDAAVEVVVLRKEGGEVVGDAYHILSTFETAGSHDATGTDAVMVERDVDNLGVARC